MSLHSESVEEQAEVEKYLTVFEGSSPEDVSHARQLWSSLSLLPPQESRLVSADIRQRLPVSRPQQRRSTATATITAPSVSDPEAASLDAARREERRKYEAMAENRREILALLKKQREQRIQKELLSTEHKPKPKPKPKVQETDQSQNRAECERDRELVQQLH